MVVRYYWVECSIITKLLSIKVTPAGVGTNLMEIKANYTFNATADKVWALLEDFGAIKEWWPKEGPITIQHVECEGKGIDMIRHIYNVGLDKPVSERLDYMDPADRVLILSIVGTRSGGITGYVAIARLNEVGTDKSTLDYHGFITCAPGQEEKIEKNIRFTWQTMFAGLRQAAESTSL